MVKSILIDDHANKLLESLLDKKVSFANTGLIIGSTEESRDYILYVIPTPPSSDGFGSPEKSISGQKCEWVVNHGMQVHDMLVGGLDILGIYCTDLSPSNGKQILLQLFKTLNDLDYYEKMKFNKDRLLFLVDTTTKNINMKSLNFSDPKASLQACQIEVKPGLFDKEFHQLNSYLNLSSVFRTPNVKSYNLIKKDFYSALTVDELFNPEKFVCLIDNVLIEDKCSFAQYLNTLPAKNGPSKQFEATLMENLSIKQRSGKKSTDTSLESIYKLNGVCSLVVIFHKSTSIGTLKQLLVYDLMRSFYARINLLVEDLDARKDIIGDEQLDDPDSDEASAIEESYQTPNRIQIRLERGKSESSFLICDYVFPDETSLDISERIRELFNYEIKECQIYFAENLPPEIKRNQDEIDSMTSEEGSNTSGKLVEMSLSHSSSGGGGLFNKVILCTSGLIAGISALAFYYLSQE